MGLNVKGQMYCPSCRVPVQASKQGHGLRNSIGAVATLGLSIKVEPWTCPTCGSKCEQLGAISSSAGGLTKRQAKAKSGGAKVEWRCAKNGHLLDRKRTTCPIDGSAAGWRAKP